MITSSRCRAERSAIEPLPLALGNTLAPDQVRHAGNGIQRRADFMAHVCKKGALCLARRFGSAHRVGQRLRALGNDFELITVGQQFLLYALALVQPTGRAASTPRRCPAPINQMARWLMPRLRCDSWI